MNNAKLKALSSPGRYADGSVRGLYIQVQKGGTKYWMFRYKRGGEQKYMGLGSYPVISLKGVRNKALNLRKHIAEGIDPKEEKQKDEAVRAASSNTFEVVARRCSASREQAFRNEKHIWQWLRTLEMYAFPYIGNIKIGEIRHPDIVRLLEPIWLTKAETAKRTRQRIESVFDFAAAHGIFDRANPANIALLKDALPRRAKHLTKSKPHPAMPASQVPSFYAALCRQGSMSALALRWTILTGARTDETLKATWDEISRKDRVWVIPPERTKTYDEFVLPLTDEMMDLLDKLEEVRNNHPYIFWSPMGPDKPMSDATMRIRLRKMGIAAETASVHGFRACLKTWGLDQGFSEEVTEAALAHKFGNKVSQSYNRTDLLEQRRGLMAQYSLYVTGAHCAAFQAERALL